MINSKPNNSNYHQGNFIPNNKNKVIKLNNQGGIYFRSSYEKKVMIWLDNSDKVIMWGAECIGIPYQLTHFENGDIDVRKHTYFPDFYYKIKGKDDSIKEVIAEVKSSKEYNIMLKLQEESLEIPSIKSNTKKLKNFEYDLKMAQKNRDKWEATIKYCDKKGWDFIIITENVLNKIGLL